MIKKRALFIFNWSHLTYNMLEFLKSRSFQYDEIICLIEEDHHCGALLVHLKQLLSQTLQKPFYLLPIARKGASLLTYCIRCRILCPSFEDLYTDDPSDKPFKETALRARVIHYDRNRHSSSVIPKGEATERLRGLFITKGQPFHLGHAKIIEQMSRELDEVVIVVAMANWSHHPIHIATGGERLEMIFSYLQEVIPDRFFLAALPYSEFSLENFYELEFLLPRFQSVHTNNPLVAALALSAGHLVRTHETGIAISSSQIREHVLKKRPYEHLVPLQVHQYLKQSPIPERLVHVHGKETR